MDIPPIIKAPEVPRLGRAKNPWRTVAVMLGVLTVVILLFIQDKQSTNSESEILALLHSLQGTNISKILIRDEKGSLLSSVSAPAAFDAFAKAVNRAEPYDQDHKPSKSGTVEFYLADGQMREFEFDYWPPSGRTVYMVFVWKYGDMTSDYARCKSAALFDWMNELLPNMR
jgi:hypothetical protein